MRPYVTSGVEASLTLLSQNKVSVLIIILHSAGLNTLWGFFKDSVLPF